MAGGTDGQIITYDANGDPVAVGPGTDGQVLTSTGSGSPPAFEDGASTTQNFTASGTISTGDLVSLNSNGTVSTSTSPIASEVVDFESAGTSYNSCCYDVDANKVVISYIDTANIRSLLHIEMTVIAAMELP